MIDRYQTSAMKSLWSDETKFLLWIEIEILYLEKISNKKDLTSIFKKLDIKKFIEKINSYEEKTRHDVVAFLYALKDELKEDSHLLHNGLTSSDIVDTAFAVTLKKASEILISSLEELLKTLLSLANSNKGQLILGRTHGQAAEITTLGLKFLSFFAMFQRNLQRLHMAKEEIAFGKLSGAVGTYSHTSPKIELEILSILGLKPEPIATQIIPRDRHSHFFSTLAIVAKSLEHLALELRLLSHSGIGEVSEHFMLGQKGSSAMPHKKNPILCENISGLCRIIASYAQAALENQLLWHERDISHSSSERIISPDATTLLDFALNRMNYILKNLIISKENIANNIQKEKDYLRSQNILSLLVEKGLHRLSAYELVQKASLQNNKSFKEALIEQNILNFISLIELENIFNLPNIVEHEEDIFKRVLFKFRLPDKNFL